MAISILSVLTPAGAAPRPPPPRKDITNGIKGRRSEVKEGEKVVGMTEELKGGA